MINVVFRFDDPSATSDHVVECTLIKELEQRGLCATFAVIPFRLVNGEKRGVDRDNAPHLLEAWRRGTIEIAQHGCCHVRLPDANPAQPSEFCGRPAAEQAALIEEGKAWLTQALGVVPVGFVPPWNTADAGTVWALEQSGFTYLASDIDNFPDYRGSLRCLPRSCGPNTAMEALDEARRLRHLNPTLVLVLHHYDFQPGGFGFTPFFEILDRIAADPQIRVLTLEQLVKATSARDGFLAARLKLAREQAHWRLRVLFPRHCLLPHPLWRAVVARMLPHGG
jgi:peptidoglycan/xylan/chitin deacetylase (PgdA/CDA1 family)